MSKKQLYRFNEDFRGGELVGIFVATPEEVKKAIGQEVYFGEVLGKHSDIYFELEAKHFLPLTNDPAAMAVIEKHVGDVGYNPLDYLRCANEDVCGYIMMYCDCPSQPEEE